MGGGGGGGGRGVVRQINRCTICSCEGMVGGLSNFKEKVH